MPADAIHLSAFADSLARASVETQRMVGRAMPAARIGTMFVDLPYFHRFQLGLLRYLVGLPQASSPWGDRFHQAAPIAFGVRLAEVGASLRVASATRGAGDALVALALGYASHAAVDTSLHPLVNRLAIERGAILGTPGFIREHQEVEKLQSVLFHETRHGRNFLGTHELGAYLSIDWRPLYERGRVSDIVAETAGFLLGVAPSRRDFDAWARGYRFFVSVIAGPLGKRAVSPEDKARARPTLIDACDYHGRYALAVERSTRWMDTLASYVSDGVCDESARSALARVMPEQSLDPAPESAAAVSCAG